MWSVFMSEEAKQVPLQEEEADAHSKKRTRKTGPSLLLKVRPLNLEAAMVEFFENNCSVNPNFE